MVQTIEMTDVLEQSLNELENAHSLSFNSALSGNTIDHSHGGISGTYIIASEADQSLLLLWRRHLYHDMIRIITQTQKTKRAGTAHEEEDWPVTSEFEGIADDTCVEFCNAHGLISDLRKCINEAKDMFSNRQNLVAEYNCYPIDEYEEEGHIVIRVEVDSDQDTAFQEYDKFVGWMLDEIVDDNLDFFVLTVDRI